MSKFTLFCIIFCFIYIICLIINPVDSTDYNFFYRSNMSLHIDNKTGCHYLSGWSGVLIPRLDEQGKHICTGYTGEQR